MIVNLSHNTSTGDDQALYSYPFAMEDDYKDFKVKRIKFNRTIFSPIVCFFDFRVFYTLIMLKMMMMMTTIQLVLMVIMVNIMNNQEI